MSTVLNVVKGLQPDTIFLGGDIIDMYPVSHWDRDPHRKLELQNDIDYTVIQLQKFRDAAPKAKILFKEGNHETRLTRYLHSKAEELSVLDALKVENLLRLDELDIEFVPNSKRYQIGKLWHLHGNEVRASGINVARTLYLRFNANIIFGHFHKMGAYFGRRYGEQSQGAWANGCLCDLDVEYDHFPQWQQGFSVIEYSKTGAFQVEQIPIIKPTDHSKRAQCMVRGVTYTHS
jgi:hypothetical protein